MTWNILEQPYRINDMVHGMTTLIGVIPYQVNAKPCEIGDPSNSTAIPRYAPQQRHQRTAGRRAIRAYPKARNAARSATDPKNAMQGGGGIKTILKRLLARHQGLRYWRDALTNDNKRTETQNHEM